MSATLSRTTRQARGPAAAAFILTTGLVPPAAAGIDPLSGIDFVHITDPGNAAYSGVGNANGRGSVPYAYHIGRMEVTTSQWVEFFNAAYDRPESDAPLPHLLPPGAWGAIPTAPHNSGGQRWAVPVGNENRFVGNISWRMAAMYCNWLHNAKSSERDAFLSGAYDVSTFGVVNGAFTDQLSRSPGARYWIPTWDEWIKAAHYDPNRDGTGQGGWWLYSNGTNDPLTPGPPGVGEANFGWQSAPGFDPVTVPLGAYPETQSPWGLLDVAGATKEWTESVVVGTSGINWRIQDGSAWGSTPGFGINDSISARPGEFPSVSFGDFGFRIASSVPTPPSAILIGGLAVVATKRRRIATGS